MSYEGNITTQSTTITNDTLFSISPALTTLLEPLIAGVLRKLPGIFLTISFLLLLTVVSTVLLETVLPTVVLATVVATVVLATVVAAVVLAAVVPMLVVVVSASADVLSSLPVVL